MEQHPVPRNISGFQFHLIGDMTIRQFAYLAAGVLSGYFIYKTAPFPAILNIPLALSVGFAGFSFAFLPIQERPLDKWLAAFIKSILSPTQYIWYKNNPPLDILAKTTILHIQVTQPARQIQAHKEAKEKLRAYLATLPTPLHESLNAAQKRYIDKTLSLFNPAVNEAIPVFSFLPAAFSQNQQVINSSAGNTSAAILVNSCAATGKSIGNKPVSPANKSVNHLPVADNKLPEKPPEIQSLETLKTTQPSTSKMQPVLVSSVTPESAEDRSRTKEDHLTLQNQLSQLAREKKALELELQKLQQQLSNPLSSQVVKPVLSSQPQNEPTVKFFSSKSAISDMGMFNSQQAPNLIAGVIKDSQKKLLPNIILTINDKSGLPVRALKTNKLGQFSAATPLPNGVYRLEVEDPMKRYVFDLAEITLSGKVFLPIEIIAKGEKELIRERLSKDLFGSQLV